MQKLSWPNIIFCYKLHWKVAFWKVILEKHFWLSRCPTKQTLVISLSYHDNPCPHHLLFHDWIWPCCTLIWFIPLHLSEKSRVTWAIDLLVGWFSSSVVWNWISWKTISQKRFMVADLRKITSTKRESWCSDWFSKLYISSCLSPWICFYNHKRLLNVVARWSLDTWEA